MQASCNHWAVLRPLPLTLLPYPLRVRARAPQALDPNQETVERDDFALSIANMDE